MAEQILTELHGREIGLGAERATTPPSRQIIVKGQVHNITMTVAPGTANVSLVTMQLVDANDVAVQAANFFTWWLSDATTGVGLTATTASGAVGAGTAGADFGVLTTKKATYVQTDATGKYILSITDTAKTLFKVCATIDVPAGQKSSVGLTLTAANYG